jgi:hypothetical protein
MAAVKSGNKNKADELITPLAKQKIAEAKLAIDPPGSPTMEYSIKAVQFIETPERPLAHVICEYKDKDENGGIETQEILWALRQEEEGWRIAGMAMKVFDDQPAVLMNFENPEDMMAKQKLITEEMDRRYAASMSNSSPSTSQAQPDYTSNPATGTDQASPNSRVAEQPKNGASSNK